MWGAIYACLHVCLCLRVASSASVRLAAIGDHGHAGPTAAAVAQLVSSWEPLDALLALGDTNYPRGSKRTLDTNVGQYYAQFIHPYKGKYGAAAKASSLRHIKRRNRFWPCPGNHDYGTALHRDLSPYLEWMPIKKRHYYDVRVGPVHLFSLDSDYSQTRPAGNSSGAMPAAASASAGAARAQAAGGHSNSSSQAVWLRTRLAASNAPWKLVFFHHPPYSSGSHGSSAHMRWPFEEWGAVAVLSGHDHSYERVLTGACGFPYFVNGMGGARTYGFQVQPIAGSTSRHTSRTGGAQLIEADSTTITFRFFATQSPEVEIDCYSARLVATPQDVGEAGARQQELSGGAAEHPQSPKMTIQYGPCHQDQASEPPAAASGRQPPSPRQRNTDSEQVSEVSPSAPVPHTDGWLMSRLYEMLGLKNAAANTTL